MNLRLSISIPQMTIISWRRFTAGPSFHAKPGKRIFSESLRIVGYEGVFIKIKKVIFSNIAPYFPKYSSSVIKYVFGQVWARGRDQNRLPGSFL